MRYVYLLAVLLVCFGESRTASAQGNPDSDRPERTKRGAQRQSAKKGAIDDAAFAKTTYAVDTVEYGMLAYRNIGPFRGGRASCVTGVPAERNTFYMGAAGGGVWKTTDGGRHWKPISDGFFGGTVGDIAVAASDPNVIYVGGGEQTLRGNVSYGYGMWRSVDAGKTWTSLGLPDSRHVGRIRVHPANPDLVYVAVIGDLYKPTEQRGVYRSKDGGKNWERILFASADAGAVDLAFDPYNPRVMYASTWRARRTPYDFSSGGEGSALWRSTDSGDNWTLLVGSTKVEGEGRTAKPAADTQPRATAKGLPDGILGIIGVAPSPAQRDRVWAIIEHETKGGVYRSDDGGNTWAKTNDSRDLRQRAWYYTRIYAHPTDADQVYVMNVSYHRSKDGGKTFEDFDAPHGDHHDLWINPDNPDVMAIADDGGAQVSTDAGENWTTYYNQPTAQFYRLATDNATPYRIYAAQQDNSTIRIKSRTDGSSITERDWETTAGCECGHLAVKPTDPDIVYGGCYDGFLERVDHETGLSRVVSVYPDNPMGHGAVGAKYRFQWNFPVFFSPHDPNKLYTASQHLHATTNEGQTWRTISPDLTRNDTSRMQSSGGPITQDNTSVEYYCTIFAAGESPRVRDLLWTGSDDGLVHVSRDGGQNWTNVTPKGLPEWTMINSLEVDPHNDGGCYLAGTRYKLGDYTPYLYHTTDYGQTWRRIDAGIPRDHFTRVIRADPRNPELLYAGTESGMYVSFDGAGSWQPLQLNLPVVPITDIALKDNDLIVATQGRSIWVLDDVMPLQELTSASRERRAFMRGGQPVVNKLYVPSVIELGSGGQSARAFESAEGTNAPGGVTVRYVLKDSVGKEDTVRMVFQTAGGDTLRVYSNHADKEKQEVEFEPKRGGNSLTWNARGADAEKFEGMILWWADMRGPRVPPGAYKVTLEAGGGRETASFRLVPDARLPAGDSVALRERYAFHTSVIDKVSEAHKAIKEIRTLKTGINAYTAKVDTADARMKPLLNLGKDMDSTLTAVEEALYQTKNRSGQDPLNYPIRLTNKLASLNSMTQGEYRPTDASYVVQAAIAAEIDAELAKYYSMKEGQVDEFNRLVRELGVPALRVE